MKPRGKWKKDRQYNGNTENRQNDKQWSTKHYTENRDRTSRALINTYVKTGALGGQTVPKCQ